MEESPYLDGRESLIDKFHKLPFFDSLDQAQVKSVLRLSKIRKFEPGEVITSENTYDSWFYIMLSGVVRVLKQKQEIARLDQVGDTFGEMAVIDGQRRSATVQAVNNTVCLAVDADQLNQAEHSPDRCVFLSIFYRLFAELISQRLRHANEELIELRQEVERLKRGNKGH